GTVEGMPADDILEVGDLITKVDDIDVNKANDLMKYVKDKTENTEVEVQFEREEDNYMEKIELAKFPQNNKVEIGIQIVTNREVEGMLANDILEVGDLITKVDDIDVNKANDLMKYVKDKTENTEVEVQFEREEDNYMEKIELAKFPQNNKVGIGIQLVTNREVEVNPEVEFSSGEIGGPSAGLMFALTIYNQLTKEDVSNGLKIAGTG